MQSLIFAKIQTTKFIAVPLEVLDCTVLPRSGMTSKSLTTLDGVKRIIKKLVSISKKKKSYTRVNQVLVKISYAGRSSIKFTPTSTFG